MRNETDGRRERATAPESTWTNEWKPRGAESVEIVGDSELVEDDGGEFRGDSLSVSLRQAPDNPL